MNIIINTSEGNQSLLKKHKLRQLRRNSVNCLNKRETKQKIFTLGRLGHLGFAETELLISVLELTDV